MNTKPPFRKYSRPPTPGTVAVMWFVCAFTSWSGFLVFAFLYFFKMVPSLGPALWFLFLFIACTIFTPKGQPRE